MSAKTVWLIFKAGMETFVTAAGVPGIIMGILGAIMPPSLIVTIPLTIGVGIFFGSIAAYRKWRDIQEKENQDQERNNIHQKREHRAKAQGEILEDIDKKLTELVELDHKMEERSQRQAQQVLQVQEEPVRRSLHSPRVYIANSPTFFVIETERDEVCLRLPPENNRIANDRFRVS
jgi:hypothetical protein